MSRFASNRPARTFAFALLAAATPALAENSVKGHFRIGDSRLEVSHGCAYRIAGDEPGSVQTLVYLSNAPLDCAAAETALDTEAALDSAVRDAEAGNVRILVGPDGSEGGLYFFLSEPFDSFNLSGSGDFAAAEAPAGQSTGSWKLAEPKEFFDKTYDFDLAWSLPLSDGPVRGEVLPAGGGEPGAALLAYVKATADDDRAAIKSLLAADVRREKFADEGSAWFEESWKMQRDWEMVEVAVLGGRIDGDRATLEITGKQGDGEKVRGRARLVREDGGWKFADRRLTITFD